MKLLRAEAVWAIAQLRYWQVRMMEGRIEQSTTRAFTSLGKVGKSGGESTGIMLWMMDHTALGVWITNFG